MTNTLEFSSLFLRKGNGYSVLNLSVQENKPRLAISTKHLTVIVNHPLGYRNCSLACMPLHKANK